MNYLPEPIDTRDIQLPEELVAMIESIAINTHENWAALRLAQGWKFGSERNDKKKEHPDLVPYENLSEETKEYDRRTTTEVLKTVIAFGFSIKKA